MSRPSTPNPHRIATSRPTTPRPDAKVAAFNRGKEHAFVDALEFCKEGLNDAGSEIVRDLRVELHNIVSAVRQEVSDVVYEKQKTLDEKMDHLLATIRNQSRAGGDYDKAKTPFCGREVDQAEATRKLVQRRDEQISQMTDLLARIELKVTSLEKVGSMNQSFEELKSRVELLDSYTRSAFTGLRELHVDGKQKRDELAFDMLAIRRYLERPFDLGNLLGEIGRTQQMVGEHFKVTISEIGHIQRALSIDFAVADVHEEDAEGRHVSLRSVSPGPAGGAAEPHASSMATTPGHARATIPMSEAEEAEAARKKRKAKTSFQVNAEPTEKQSRTASPDPEETTKSLLKFSKKRVREFFSQTEDLREDNWTQTVQDVTSKKAKKFVSAPVGVRAAVEKEAFNDGEALKRKARQALLQPQYDVQDYYHETGWVQQIAKSQVFDNLTVAVVSLNALWIAIDTDNNPAAVLIDAEPLFIIVENLFCAYFAFEVFIRFMAFARKRHAFMDKWFIFDFLLVLNMVIETWIVPGVMLALHTRGDGNTIDVSMLRTIRLVKLLRLSRISRLLRSVPELTIILRAIGFAARSVFVFFLLWLVIIYVFAVLLRQLTEGQDVGGLYFGSVGASMNTLLLNGILADYAPLVNGVYEEGDSLFLWAIMLFFVLLTCITIMYMLVGVLVDVVGVIAGSEKENYTVAYVAAALRTKLEENHLDLESPIDKKTFQDILVSPETAQVLQQAHIDVIALLDHMKVSYEDLDRRGESMTFEKMVDMVLKGRGSNNACVRDTQDLLRILKQIIVTAKYDVLEKMTQEFASVQAGLTNLQEAAQDSDAEEAGFSGKT
eukprot:TRINITY_DN92876_c0_g1_i1.p1 TRINITY_DN92876_c0_g1~~TRINITY_DN92876_c0_g1_i1.p1  ORF type:complete len:843 (-),score=185.97 TRINITY_DN92876_c0_g1_i1:118-2619(-)